MKALEIKLSTQVDVEIMVNAEFKVLNRVKTYFLIYFGPPTKQISCKISWKSNPKPPIFVTMEPKMFSLNLCNLDKYVPTNLLLTKYFRKKLDSRFAH